MREDEKKAKKWTRKESTRERRDKGRYTQRSGGRGGQTRPYTQTVGLTINRYYYIITIWEQRQCIAT